MMEETVGCETTITGFPQIWAFIEGQPFILSGLAISHQRDTISSTTSMKITSQSIKGSGILFHPNCAPPVFGHNGKPITTDLKVVELGELTTFEQTIFTARTKIPHYNESVACKVEWESQDIDQTEIKKFK